MLRAFRQAKEKNNVYPINNNSDCNFAWNPGYRVRMLLHCMYHVQLPNSSRRVEFTKEEERQKGPSSTSTRCNFPRKTYQKRSSVALYTFSRSGGSTYVLHRSTHLVLRKGNISHVFQSTRAWCNPDHSVRVAPRPIPLESPGNNCCGQAKWLGPLTDIFLANP